MQSFTLDTNCIIAIDEGREPAASAVRALVECQKQGTADVAVVAIAASERQKDQPIDNFDRFQERLKRIGLADLPILRPLGYWDVTFHDWCVYGDDQLAGLERSIHDVLFPNSPFEWADFCTQTGLDVTTTPIRDPWRNRKCDVLCLWTHIHSKRDVFVTDDKNFHAQTKHQRLVDLGAGQIVNAVSAAALLP